MADVQVSVEVGAGLERRLRVQVPAARVEQEIAARLKSAGRGARLKGFRPGKVPPEVIRQRFGPQIRQEVIQDVVRSSCSEAIAREKLRAAGSPRIEMAPQQPGGDVVYTAVFETFPEFRVSGIESLTVDKPAVAVVDADIDRTIERLRVQRADWVTTARPAASGDRVTLDFAGSRSGTPMPGGSAENYTVVIGEGRMVAGFEAQLIGMAAAGERTFPVVFPADYHEPDLRGAEVVFAVRVHEVAERVLPAVDADFIRSFEVPSGDLADFRRLVRENLEREAAGRIQGELRRQVMEALLAANPVELPVVMVTQEAAGLQAEAARGLAGKQAPPISAYDDVARRRVRLGLIFGALIREYGLKIDPARVDQKLEDLCRPYEQPAEVRRLYRQSPELMSQVENSVMEEYVLEWLLERAQVRPRAVAFTDLMGA